MTPTVELIESVARALCAHQGINFDRLSDGPMEVAGGTFIWGRNEYRDQAKAAIKVMPVRGTAK